MQGGERDTEKHSRCFDELREGGREGVREGERE